MLVNTAPGTYFGTVECCSISDKGVETEMAGKSVTSHLSYWGLVSPHCTLKRSHLHTLITFLCLIHGHHLREDSQPDTG